MGSVSTAMLGVERAALQGDLTKPQQWEEVGSVHQLYIYPVKSLGCVKVNKFTTGPWAPESESLVDRQLMVLDGKGKMVTARKYPHMTLVEPQVISDRLTLKYPGMLEVTVQLPKVNEVGKEVALDVFGEACRGLDLGDEVGEWLSEVILNDSEAGMRLVFHPKGDSTRPDKASNPKIFPMRKPKDKHPRGEPLKTLRKYRCALDPAEKKTFGSSPFLGVGLGVDEPGEVIVGDKVFIGKTG